MSNGQQWRDVPLPGFQEESARDRVMRKAADLGRSVASSASQAPQPSEFEQKLSQGNLPLFMTPTDIVKHVNLVDSGYERTGLGNKDLEQRLAEEDTLNYKLQEAKKPHTVYNAHGEHTAGDIVLDQDSTSNNIVYRDIEENTPSLYESLVSEGMKTPLSIDIDHRFGPRRMNLVNGHHRLAALRNLNPDQFLNINWDV